MAGAEYLSSQRSPRGALPSRAEDDARFILPVPGGEPQRMAIGWLWLGLAALVISGLFSVLIVLSRTPYLQAVIPWVDFFHTALVVHVDLSVLVWFLAFAGVLWSLNSTAHCPRCDAAALGLAILGTAIIAAAPFLGAGNALNVLDFFLMADGGILVVTPEPTSIENSYRFLKSAFYRRLRSAVSSPEAKALIDGASDRKNELGIQNPTDLIEAMARIGEEEARRVTQEVEHFHPNLILNQVRTKKDIEVGFSIRSACKKYFGIHLHYLGYIVYDQEVSHSIRKRRPLVLENPHSKAAQCVSEIALKLSNREQTPFRLQGEEQ